MADRLSPEGDRSDVELGDSAASATVARRLLEAAGIPGGVIELGDWPYSLGYPLQKEGGGSYVAQAGALAFANNHRHLYQGSDGIIRATEWSGATGAAVATIAIPGGELRFEPNPDPVQPVENLKVVGQGFAVTTLPAVASTFVSDTEPASNYKDNAAGSVLFTTIQVERWGVPGSTPPGPWSIFTADQLTPLPTGNYYWTQTETLITEPAILVYIGSDSLSSAPVRQYATRFYKADTKELFLIHEFERVDVRAIVADGKVGSSTAFGDRTSRYRVTSLQTTDGIVRRQLVTERLPLILIEGAPTNGDNFALTVSAITDTTWAEDRPNFWVERIRSKRAAGANPSDRGGKVKPQSLLAGRPQARPNSRPSQPETWPESSGLQELHYEGIAQWQHPGGATGLSRTRTITVTPGFSNAQCFEVAVREVRLLEGRRQAYLIDLPLSNSLIGLPPASQMAITDGSNLWQFAMDAPTWEFNVENSGLLAQGIVLSRTALPDPVSPPLPTFADGLLPDQGPSPEPPPFEPPGDVGQLTLNPNGVPVTGPDGEFFQGYVEV